MTPQTLRRGLPRVVGGDAWPPTRDDGAPAPVSVRPTRAATVADSVVLSAVAADTLRRASSREPVASERRGALTARPGRTLAVAVGAVAVVLLLGIVSAFARVILSTEVGQQFLQNYPGGYAPAVGRSDGFPAWMRWQHFFNVFLLVLIVRTGLQIRSQRRPPAVWSSRRHPDRKISVTLLLHLVLDVLWIANGVVFVVLLAVSGYWARIVPTSWDVLPHALSAALQYAALDWPTEDGWSHYNALQQLAYFATVFVAAPLAVLSGVRMSGFWPRSARLARLYPIEAARAIHFPVMLYFVAFTVVHVCLVFATGALRNLNHMFGPEDSTGWVGLWVFLASCAVILTALAGARPRLAVRPASRFGTVSSR